MGAISEVQLMRVLRPTSELSSRRLPDAESIRLATLLGQMADRYPHQDLTDSLDGYLEDYGQLALRYSFEEVQAALAEWRITPGASFFPRPDEIADSICTRREERTRQAEMQARDRRRRAEVEEFWRQAPEFMAMAGIDETELVRRFPSYRGTKPHLDCEGDAR